MNCGVWGGSMREDAESKAVPERRERRGMGLLCAPYLALIREDAPQRAHDLLPEVFNALRWILDLEI